MPASLTALGTTGDAYRVVIEPAPEGAYLFVFQHEQSAFPERDHLLDDVEAAKQVALEEFGVSAEAWTAWAGESLV